MLVGGLISLMAANLTAAFLPDFVGASGHYDKQTYDLDWYFQVGWLGVGLTASFDFAPDILHLTSHK